MNAESITAAEQKGPSKLEVALRSVAPALLDVMRDEGIECLELALDAGTGRVTFVKHQRGSIDVEPNRAGR